MLLIKSSMTPSVWCILTVVNVLPYLSAKVNKMPVSKKEVGECPVDAMMRVMDGRWKGTILWRLQEGAKRTSELKRSIPGITERMLIRHLQELVADGIVKRDDKKTIPPCVYYSLSPYGRTLGPVVQMMCDWGRSHLKRSAARR